MERINFLVPIKSLADSKQRLSGMLSPPDRIKLVTALLEKNLMLLGEFFPEHNILVVTPDNKIATIAKKYQADVLLEDKPGGLNKAVEAGTQWSIAQGYKTQVIIAPDIAQLSIKEVKQLLSGTGKKQRVIICAAKDKGTNAILTTPPNVIPFNYGKKSSEVMSSYAQNNGVSCQVLQLPYLALDIDTPEDLLQVYPDYLLSTYTTMDMSDVQRVSI